jgi:trans-2,3-dihydro-3-hydroxyanthranilate isomerase
VIGGRDVAGRQQGGHPRPSCRELGRPVEVSLVAVRHDAVPSLRGCQDIGNRNESDVTYDFVIVDVFTERPFGGNQLAVLTDARGLTQGQMQAIAREFNFAESTFVLPAQGGATARLRIFTPQAEIPFAGHPTVGSAAVLARMGLVPTVDGRASVVFAEGVGPVQVEVSDVEGALHAELRLDAVLDLPDRRADPAALAAVLGLPIAAVREAWFASVGLPFCFVRVASDAEVDAAVLDRPAWRRALADAPAELLYFFAGDLVDGGEVYARMFAPTLGIDEDPATGAAAAALVACVALRDGRRDAEVRLRIRQGFAMGRPSHLAAGAVTEEGRLRHVTVAGGVVVFATGAIEVAPGRAT